MVSLLRSFLHGSHQVRLTQQVSVASSEIRSDTCTVTWIKSLMLTMLLFYLHIRVDRSMRHRLCDCRFCTYGNTEE